LRLYLFVPTSQGTAILGCALIQVRAIERSPLIVHIGLVTNDEIPQGQLETAKRKEQEFYGLVERFRDASDPEEVKRLGEDLGRMVFGKDDAL
jgi:hypothetical protein